MTKSRTRNRSHSAPFHGKQKNSGNDSWLWGHHAVTAALQNPDRILKKLVMTRNAAARMDGLTLQYEDMAPEAIDRLLPAGAVHQGVAASFEPLAPLAIEDIIDGPAQRVVVLDQITDPHNLGAIFRSASAFGFSAIILQTRNTPPITGIVAKSAAGAIETVKECRVVNVSRTLQHLADGGFHTVGLSGDGDTPIVKAVANANRLAIILGAEGAGLRHGVANACAELAHIPIAAEMESLNVSNAAAIAFYEAARTTPKIGQAPH